MGSSFSTKFERKFGKYAIPNISLYLIICYAVGYLLSLIYPAFLGYLTLDPFEIFLHGQVWRLFTWILIPPSSSNLFFTLIMLVFYYSIGTQLERTWGTYRHNLYLFLGMIFTIAGSIILFLYCLLIGAQPLALGTETIYSLSNGIHVYFGSFSTYYINMSIFLAYAATFPEMQVLLMFIIPVKMKWMAIFYVVIVVYEMIQYIMAGAWYLVIPIVASLLNFIIFYFGTKDFSRYNPKEVHRRNEFRRAMEPQGRMKSGSGSVTKHKCAICGRTELDDPNLEFRFCSRCNGNYEYCQDYLFTHTHVK